MGLRREALGLIAGLALVLTAASFAAKPKAPPGPVTARVDVQRVALSAKPHGEPGTSGSVTICLDPSTGTVAYNFTALTLAGKPTKGQMRRGTAGAAVVTFGAPGTIDPCVGEVEWNDFTPATASAASQLATSPSGFYVTVDTRTFSKGALSGRLAGRRRVASGSDAASECAFS